MEGVGGIIKHAMWWNSWVHWLLGCTSRQSHVGGRLHIRSEGCWFCIKSSIPHSACPCHAWLADDFSPSWSPVFTQWIIWKHQLVKNLPCSLIMTWQSNRTSIYFLNNSREGLEKVSVLCEGHPAKEKGECRRKAQIEHDRKQPEKEQKDCSVPAFVDQEQITSE